MRPFVQRINVGRIDAGYKPYEPSFIAKQMAKVKTEDLYKVYQDLVKGRSFGGLWEHYYGVKRKRRA